MKKQMTNTGRWWEAYLIRYAVGTIVGAACIYAIFDLFPNELKASALMMPNIAEKDFRYLIDTCNAFEDQSACILKIRFMQDLYGFNFPQLFLLGIYGLAFCYIASAPVLVAHAIRRQYSTLQFTTETDLLKTTIDFTFFIAAIAAILCLFFIKKDIDFQEKIIIFFALFLTLKTLAFIFFQIALLLREFHLGEALFDFYANLEAARQNEKINLDSYRHLRENGNAFLIVILEIILFLVISSICYLGTKLCPEKFIQNIRWLIVIFLALWILPGAMVYFVGQRIEALMIKDHLKNNQIDLF